MKSLKQILFYLMLLNSISMDVEVFKTLVFNLVKNKKTTYFLKRDESLSIKKF